MIRHLTIAFIFIFSTEYSYKITYNNVLKDILVIAIFQVLLLHFQVNYAILTFELLKASCRAYVYYNSNFQSVECVIRESKMRISCTV
jgi:hypothetical protein